MQVFANVVLGTATQAAENPRAAIARTEYFFMVLFHHYVNLQAPCNSCKLLASKSERKNVYPLPLG